MSLASRVDALATRVGQELKSLRAASVLLGVVQTITAAKTIQNAAATNALVIDQNGNAPASTSVGGALLVENTGSTGAGVVVYSAQGAPLGHLLVVRANSATFNQSGLYVDYVGLVNALNVNNKGTGNGNGALNLASTNTEESTLKVSGVETGRGTAKITHTGTGSDVNASAMSLDLKGVGTAAQGLFIDATDGGTIGKLLNLRNGGAERLVLSALGQLFIAGPLEVVEQAAPATPVAGRVLIYAKADGLVYAKDDAGVETVLSESAGLAPQATWPRVYPNRLTFTTPSAGNTATVMTQSRMFAVPFILPRETTFAMLGVNISAAVAGSTCRLGLYASGDDGLPAALLAEFGSVSTAGTGYQSLVPAAPPTLERGVLYFLAGVSQGGAPTYRCSQGFDPLVSNPDLVSPNFSTNYSCYTTTSTSITGALPDPFGAVGAAAIGPRFGIQFT